MARSPHARSEARSGNDSRVHQPLKGRPAAVPVVFTSSVALLSVLPPLSEPTGVPAWKELPSWAVVATGDIVVGTDAVRSMAERAGAEITEVEGSHVIMLSRPQVVAEAILTALAAVCQDTHPTT